MRQGDVLVGCLQRLIVDVQNTCMLPDRENAFSQEARSSNAKAVIAHAAKLHDLCCSSALNVDFGAVEH